jgi:hypothetical protein
MRNGDYPVSTMDPLSTAIAKEGIAAATEAAKGFLSKLLGPANEELGLLFQDQVKFYRFKNQLRVLSKAEAMLIKAGLAANAVPFRTLLPILENAAAEDDDSLSTKWAALLANAAAKADSPASHPSFPRILSEISPAEARFLDSLVGKGGEADWELFKVDMATGFSVTHDDIDRYYGNLFRLGLVRIASREGLAKGVVQVGPFGKAFISACSPPEVSAHNIT